MQCKASRVPLATLLLFTRRSISGVAPDATETGERWYARGASRAWSECYYNDKHIRKKSVGGVRPDCLSDGRVDLGAGGDDL